MEEPVESNHGPSSTAAIPSPPGIGPMAFAGTLLTGASSLRSPLPLCVEKTADANDRPSKGVTSLLPWAPSLLPADFAPALARMLDGRWQTYRQELRVCQKEF